MTSKKKPHHHGNLREALVQAGIDLLAEGGTEALTLRRAAARAGVSHAAPAHHFKGLNGLLLAIAAEGFRTFTDTMREEIAKSAPDPQSQLLGMCKGYLRFAKDHEALFTLIFSTEIKNRPDADLETASMEAFGVLVDTCDLFEPAPEHPLANAIMVWSLVHGYAGLRRFDKLMLPDDDQPMPFQDLLPRLTPRAP